MEVGKEVMMENLVFIENFEKVLMKIHLIYCKFINYRKIREKNMEKFIKNHRNF